MHKVPGLTAEEKIQAVMESASLTGKELGAFLRKSGSIKTKIANGFDSMEVSYDHRRRTR